MQAESSSQSFRLGEKTPGVVRRCFQALSYREASEEDDENWNIYWRVGNFKTGDWERCLPHQRINHLPKAWHITTKDSLVRSLRVMSSSHGSLYSFAPVSWILPSEYTKFMRDFYEEREKDESCLFIAKPADLSRGRFVTTHFSYE
jgi:tubulin polyglutamylase TTLL2